MGESDRYELASSPDKAGEAESSGTSGMEVGAEAEAAARRDELALLSDAEDVDPISSALRDSLSAVEDAADRIELVV